MVKKGEYPKEIKYQEKLAELQAEYLETRRWNILAIVLSERMLVYTQMSFSHRCQRLIQKRRIHIGQAVTYKNIWSNSKAQTVSSLCTLHDYPRFSNINQDSSATACFLLRLITKILLHSSLSKHLWITYPSAINSQEPHFSISYSDKLIYILACN